MNECGLNRWPTRRPLAALAAFILICLFNPVDGHLFGCISPVSCCQIETVEKSGSPNPAEAKRPHFADEETLSTADELQPVSDEGSRSQLVSIGLSMIVAGALVYLFLLGSKHLWRDRQWNNRVHWALLLLSLFAWAIAFLILWKWISIGVGFSSLLEAVGFVIIAATVVWMLHRLVPPHYRRRNTVIVGLTLGISAFVCAFAAVLLGHSNLTPLDRYSIAAYEATRVLSLGSSLEEHRATPGKLYSEFARIIACVLAFFIAYKAVVTVFQDAVSAFRVYLYQLKSTRNVNLVCGLGSVGIELVRNLRAGNERVVVIEADGENPNLRTARDLGAVVLVGDATDSDMLDWTPFDALSNAYAVTGDDHRNIQIAMNLVTFAQQRLRRSRFARVFLQSTEALHCNVQIFDPDLKEGLQRVTKKESRPDSEDERRPVRLHHFNSQQHEIWNLICGRLSDADVRPTTTDEVACYVIAGFDHLGQEVVFELAQLAHFENLKRSRMLIMSDQHPQPAERFVAKYPFFAGNNAVLETIGDVSFSPEHDDWTDDEDGHGNRQGVSFASNAKFTTMPASPCDRGFLESLEKLIQPKLGDNGRQARVRPVMIVCMENWSSSFSWASEFAHAWKAHCLRKNLQPFVENGHDFPVMPVLYWLPGRNAIRDVSGELADDLNVSPFGSPDLFASPEFIKGHMTNALANVVDESYAVVTDSKNASPMKFGRSRYEDHMSSIYSGQHGLIKYKMAGREIDFRTEGIRDIELEKLDQQPIKELKCELCPEDDGPQFPTAVHPRDDVDFQGKGPGENFTITDAEGREKHGVILSSKPDGQTDATLVFVPYDCISDIARVEHYRWCSEQLLKNHEWIETEPPRVGGSRLPQYAHLRQTLCSWDRMLKSENGYQEFMKDLSLSFYVLKAINRIEQQLRK